MTNEAPREMVTGLEDDDNFFELIRQLGRLPSIQDAIQLAAQVLSEILLRVPIEGRAQVRAYLPSVIRDQLSENVVGLRAVTLARLEHDVQARWKVEIDQAARLVAAVGIALSERLPVEVLSHFRSLLPGELQRLFPERAVAHL